MSKAPVGSVLKAADIAAKPGIPPEYLVQVFSMLKAAGIVESVRGKRGGYRLAKPPREITVAEVMEAVESLAEPAVDLEPVLEEVLQRAAQAAKAALVGVSFEELRRREQECKEIISYSI